MSHLIVLDFDGINTADEVLTKLRSLQKSNLIDLEDSCVVIREAGGKVQVKQSLNLTALGAVSGARTGMFIGVLAGLLMMNPIAGMAAGLIAGGSAGALSGSMADYGINDDFIKELGSTIAEGTSALFLLVRSATPEKVIREIEPFKPNILRTSLSDEQEANLKAMVKQISG